MLFSSKSNIYFIIFLNIFFSTGCQHAFLIRNPYMTFDSWKKVINRGIDEDKKIELDQIPEPIMPAGKFFKEQYDLYQYARDILGQNPPIVDADELLANPAEVMKAFFKAIGVPYKEEYLTWVPGNYWLEKMCVISKEQIYSQQLGSLWHEVTFKTTGFVESLRKYPNRDDLPDDVVRYADLSMKYYEEMYARRLKPL